MIGRDEVVAAVGAVIDRAVAGTSSALMVRGEAGMGKSTLIDDTAARARKARFTVLSTRGSAVDAEIGFASLLTLLRPIEGELDALAGNLADPIRAALTLGSDDEPDGIAVRLGVYRVITSLADRGPVVVVVDDGHLLDAVTADILAFVLGRLSADQIAVIVATGGALPSLLATVPIDATVLSALRADDLRQIVRADGPIADGALEPCCALAGGNPLVALELARALDPDERSGLAPVPAVPRPPEALANGFIAQLADLPVATQRALVVVAADETGDLELVRRALTELGEPTDALDVAEAAGLVRIDGSSIRLAHPLWRSVAYHQVAPASRRAAHRALAARLDRPQDAAARAMQLAAAANGKDDRAASALELVADDLTRRGGQASAARVLERAATLAADDAHRTSLLVGAARAWLASYQPAAARRVVESIEWNGEVPLIELVEVIRWLDGPAEARRTASRRGADESDPAITSVIDREVLVGTIGVESLERARELRNAGDPIGAYDHIAVVSGAVPADAGLPSVPVLLTVADLEVLLGRRADARSHLDTITTLIRGSGWRSAEAEVARLTAVLVEDDPAVSTRSDVEAELTASEYRVALAVAKGGTNREVAGSLFLSVKTVDFHLQNIYRKLVLRSRTELAVRMSRDVHDAARRDAAAREGEA